MSHRIKSLRELARRSGMELHTANCPAGRRTGECICDVPPSSAGKRKDQKASTKRRGVMNKTEQRYASEVLDPMVIDGKILAWEYETHRLLIARKTGAEGSRSTYYCPDFVLYRADGRVEFHDVKGYHGTTRAHRSGKERDGRIKIKVAADRYRYHRFAIVWREGGQWQREDL